MEVNITVSNKYRFDADVLPVIFEAFCEGKHILINNVTGIDEHTLKVNFKSEEDYLYYKLVM